MPCRPTASFSAAGELREILVGLGERRVRRRRGGPVDARARAPAGRGRGEPGRWPAWRDLPGGRRVGRRRGGWPRSRRAPAHRLRIPRRRALRPDPASRRHAAGLPPPSRPRRPVPPRRAAGPDCARRCDRGGARCAARPASLHLGTTTQAEFLVGLGTDELLAAIQADPATTMEAYLAVRSALIRLLDPAAMGRFRVMAFGRGWPDGAPPAGLAYRLARPRTTDHT